jgi:hypothetical protein
MTNDTELSISDTQNQNVQAMLDEWELFKLVKAERLARDAGRWEQLQACYWPNESRVRVTWFDGSSEEFIERSRAQLARGSRGMHSSIPAKATIEGDRALVESVGGIKVRAELHGVEADIDHWCRFLVRAERRAGQWRICQFDGIYGKDRLCAVRPDQSIPIDWSLAEPLRDSYRWLAYLNVAKGYPYEELLPGVDRPDLVAEFESESDAWVKAARAHGA